MRECGLVVVGLGGHCYRGVDTFGEQKPLSEVSTN